VYELFHPLQKPATELANAVAKHQKAVQELAKAEGLAEYLGSSLNSDEILSLRHEVKSREIVVARLREQAERKRNQKAVIDSLTDF